MLQPFFIRHNRVLKRIHPGDVVCLVTEGNYTRIFLADKSFYLVRSTLSDALRKLPPGMFVQIHRSIAASVYFIDNIDRDHLLIGNESMPVARKYYQSLVDALNIIE
ncbi:MAG TPA: LytTR family DNA-binding domain-containing protein [Chitinophagaceae bacterium]|jgi:DNA-binding LytR/AlgR family response regulator|nr:LytTR family DNA-binding domain-containing protein [Chitinophagaceae bacterium]